MAKIKEGEVLCRFSDKTLSSHIVMNNQHFISRLDSETVSFLRLPMALGVIFIHLGIKASGADIIWSDMSDSDVFKLVVCVVTNELSALAVPVFFVVAGYLFYAGFDLERGNVSSFCAKKIAKRFRSLLVPYIIFNLLSMIGLLTVAMLTKGRSFGEAVASLFGDGRWVHCFWDVHTTGHTVNLFGISKATAYPINAPLWFVRDLIVLVLMSPVLAFAMRYLRSGWLWLIGVCVVTGVWIPLPGFGVTSCMFFSFGAWLALSRKSPVVFSRRYNVVLLPLSVVLLVADILCDGTVVDKYVHLLFLVVGVFMTIGLASLFVEKRFLPIGLFGRLDRKVVGRMSFFVFAVHAAVIPVWGMRPVEWVKSLLWSGSAEGLTAVVEYFCCGLLSFAVCVVLFVVLRKLCRPVVDFATGR